jgi:RHS repeat-associated protein
MQEEHSVGGAWGYLTDTPGSGLLQLGARFYWPEVGRFVQRDPLVRRANDYAYARNRPLWYADPSGLWEAGGEAYLLFGGGVFFGHNCDGTWYVKFKAGVGLGAGAGYDPCGESPSPSNGGPRPSSGSFFGLSGYGGVQIGPLSKGRASSMGVISDSSGNISDYGGPDWDWSPPGYTPGVSYPPTFIGLGVSDTAEGGFFF